MNSDVKASIQLAADGRLTGYIAGSAANLGPVRIKSIQAQTSAADGEIKIYDAATASGDIKIHLKWGEGANEGLEYNFPGGGVRFETTVYVDLTNCNSFIAYYT